MAIITFSQAILPTLTCPAGQRRIEYCDESLPGLLLEVRASGSASWLLRYKAGTTKYVNLGAAIGSDSASSARLSQGHEGEDKG